MVRRLEIGTPTERQLRRFASKDCPWVFINYRSNEEADFAAAGLLYEGLIDLYGKEQIFMARRSICPGTYFDNVIMAAVKQARVLIALMTENWTASLPTTDTQPGHPYVVNEIDIALRGGATVLPVRVDGNMRRIPDPDALPAQIARIAGIQAMSMPVSRPAPDAEFGANTQAVVDQVGFLLPELLSHHIDEYMAKRYSANAILDT